jgi:DNA anti-recombination protein RmuC
VSARIVGAGDAIRARVDDLRAVLDGKGVELLTALGERGDDVSARIVGAGDSVRARIDDLRRLIDGKGADLLAALGERGEDVSARIVGVGEAIGARVDDLRQVFDGKGAELLAALGERGDDVSARIVGVGERAMHTIDQQMAGLAALLTRRTDELIAAVNGSAADPVRALSALTGQLRAEVADSSEALRRAAAEAAHRSSETIDALLKQLTEQVDASGAALRETVTRSAENSVETLAGTGERLRDELTQVIDNLGQTGAVIDRAIVSAGDRLAAVQGGLATRVDEFQRALGSIASQVATLGRLSATTQSDASTLAEQLAQHAEALGVVGRDLAQQQQSLDHALEHRQSSLQSLVVELASRSEAFETTLGRFAANVEDNFARAQARAQEISAALASATKGASIAVAGQFETIRDTTARERERTAQALKTTLEQTNAQLSGALEHAAERFRQSVAEVKDMTHQVQRELDQTRGELRRGVLDLPQETSEAADAMRRVVSDQIRALKELAALVSDSGANYDVAEPAPLAVAPPPVAATRFDRPPSRLAEVGRRVEAHSPREPALPRAAEAIAAPLIDAPPPAQIVAPELIPPTGRPAQSWSAPPASGPLPTATQAAQAIPAAAPAADRGQAGWLSNLLAAASRDEPEAPAPKGAETLEALTLEIAGLIDNAAAMEMWERWRRGDTAAVSRRLYTEAGQQAFDEIRRRYRADPQFRDTATRYVQEFERLLAKVGQSDRDGSQWRAYLLSNTGKVYTILAHASGRLG